jgi:hypothetical protein
VVLFTRGSAVTIFDDGTGTLEDLRRMAEAVRPVSGPADTTKPLPPPTPGLRTAIDAECGASPGDQGTRIED